MKLVFSILILLASVTTFADSVKYKHCYERSVALFGFNMEKPSLLSVLAIQSCNETIRKDLQKITHRPISAMQMNQLFMDSILSKDLPFKHVTRTTHDDGSRSVIYDIPADLSDPEVYPQYISYFSSFINENPDFLDNSKNSSMFNWSK